MEAVSGYRKQWELNYSTQMLLKSQFGRANVVVDEIETIEPNHHWASPMGRVGEWKNSDYWHNWCHLLKNEFNFNITTVVVPNMGTFR